MSMGNERRIELPGSARKALARTTKVGAVDPDERFQVTLRLRPRQPLPSAHELGSRDVRSRRYLTREEFASAYGADAHDLELVEAFAHEYGLDIVELGVGRCTVILSGTAASMKAAFGTELERVEHKGKHCRHRTGTVSLPQSLSGVVTGVFGLDNRPQVRPHLRRAKADAEAQWFPGSFTPLELARLYDFPTQVDGSGQCIAIIELGGGFRASELNTYFKQLGLQHPPKVTAVSVGGAHNTPGVDLNADGEVLLDIEVAGAVAPGAQLAVYFAPNTTDGFLNAINAALHDAQRKPSVISISWGHSEDTWTVQAMQEMDKTFQAAALLGVTVLVAAGDNGSADYRPEEDDPELRGWDGKSHVDFPASSPHVLACGGTKLVADGTTITREVVWNEDPHGSATGGGVSDVFPLPPYQADARVPGQAETGKPGRGVPDVAAVADPTTGYRVRVDKEDHVIGGTSAVAPLYAGLIALLNQAKGKPVGFINPLLYLNGGKAFRDVTQGKNGAYSAGPGWDACTGWGSTLGTKLLGSL
jgi:kumamolisin